MDDNSSDDAPAPAQRQFSPQRPRRGTKVPGFYKPINPLRPPAMTSRSNIIPKNKGPKDKGKRKRVDSPTSDGESEQGGSNGEGEGEDNVDGDGEGEGEVRGRGRGRGRGRVRVRGRVRGSDNGKDDRKGATKTKGKPGRKAKATTEEVRERTPPSECEARPTKKDQNLKIAGDAPKMEDGEAPRYYAKVSRVVEVTDDNGKNPNEKTIEENYRMPNHPPVVLPAVDMSLLRTPDCVHVLPDRELVRFAMDPLVLPLLKQWAYMWLNPDKESKQFHKDMHRTFPLEGDKGKPWKIGVQLVAEHAAHQTGFTQLLAPLLFSMSRFAQRLVNANGAFFKACSAYSRATNEQYKFAARLLLIVWEDVEKHDDGFFRILFKGELARPNRPEMREVYEAWYVVDERLFR